MRKKPQNNELLNVVIIKKSKYPVIQTFIVILEGESQLEAYPPHYSSTRKVGKEGQPLSATGQVKCWLCLPDID